jgi:hypothetical protein
MENPCCNAGVAEVAEQSPNRRALATRKLCQNDEILEGLAR